MPTAAQIIEDMSGGKFDRLLSRIKADPAACHAAAKANNWFSIYDASNVIVHTSIDSNEDDLTGFLVVTAPGGASKSYDITRGERSDDFVHDIFEAIDDAFMIAGLPMEQYSGMDQMTEWYDQLFPTKGSKFKISHDGSISVLAGPIKQNIRA